MRCHSVLIRLTAHSTAIFDVLFLKTKLVLDKLFDNQLLFVTVIKFMLSFFENNQLHHFHGRNG